MTSSRAQLSARTWLIAIAVGLVTVGLRAVNLRTSYELFIDEVTYADIGRSFAAGDGSQLYDKPFHLHPPLFFMVLGLVTRIFGQSSDAVLAVLDLRWINLGFAFVTAMALVLLLSVLVNRWAGLAVGVLYAVDSFIIRFDSRVMLEASMTTWVVLGYLFWIVAVRRFADNEQVKLTPHIAGFFFGLAMVTKETAFFVTVLPLVVALVFPFLRGTAVKALAIVLSVYGVYLAWIIATGEWASYWAEKTSGVLRVVGAEQATGYNAPGSPSFIDRLVANLSTFASAYLVIGIASVLLLFIVVRAVRMLRLNSHASLTKQLIETLVNLPRKLGGGTLVILLWQGCSVIFLLYAIFIGTLEEQMFYILLVPSMVVTVLGVTRFIPTTERGGAVRKIIFALLAVSLAFSSFNWVRIHTSPDDQYLAFSKWAAVNLEVGDRVSVTEETAQFVLPRVVLLNAYTPAVVESQNAEYVLIADSLVDQGYGFATPEFRDYLDANGEVVFDGKGRTLGALKLYRLP